MKKRVTFENRSGLKLTGVLHSPDTGQIRAYALFAHCFTCTMNINAAINIAEALTARNIAVLRFDFTGLGGSEGDFADTHFSSNTDDLEDAARYMTDTWGAPALLAGHSLGGTAALAVASRIESVKAVATIGSPADAEHVLHLLEDNIEEIEAEGSASVKLAGRPFRIRKDFIDDVRAQSVKENLRSLRKALLIMHSPIDEMVSVDQASLLFSNAIHPKSFISLDKADHLLTKSRDSREAGRLLAEWAEGYLGDPVNELVFPEADKEAVIARLGADDAFLTTINAQGHQVLADEPVAYGGKELGPTPYGYLSAGLAACTAMTIRMYAGRKKWPLEHVEVRTTHNKIHAEECAECETTQGKLDHFDRKIELVGDLTDEQRQRLLEIADRCPVHKSLHNEVKITTSL